MNTTPDNPVCSVIVPVFNHWNLVPKLIECLTRQTVGTDNFELLLVDNGSDHIPEDVELPAFARLLHCDTPGSYAARNTGIDEAHGEYVAFTDADCQPSPDWLEYAIAFAERQSPDQTIVAGAVAVLAAEDREPNPYELYDMAVGLPQIRYVQRGYGTTANLVLCRTIIQTVGQFDTTRYSGGDAAFCRQAGRQGIATRYCAQAVVFHPARGTWEELASKVRRIKGGQISAGPYHRRILYALRTLLPPVERWHTIMTSNRLRTTRERLIVFNVQCRLWITEIAELIRLSLGNKPTRS